MAKKKKISIVVIVALLAIAIGTLGYFYLQEYQKIVNEAAVMRDNHCIAVNPLIIDKKTAYIGSMKSIIASDSAAYISAQHSWIGSAKEYLTLEQQWLRNEQEFLDRKDVKLLLNSSTQEAAHQEYTMFEEEYKGTQAVVKLFATKNVNLREVNKHMLQIETERKLSQQSYDLKWGNPALRLGFRDQFIKQPVSQCPEKNRQIPSIETELGR